MRPPKFYQLIQVGLLNHLQPPQARQLQAQLERLTEISTNLDRSLCAYEELTRGDQEVLQKLEDANDVTEGERMTTKRYEHMLTRVQEELSRLKGSVDTITKEVKGAEKARVSRRFVLFLVVWCRLISRNFD